MVVAFSAAKANVEAMEACLEAVAEVEAMEESSEAVADVEALEESWEAVALVEATEACLAAALVTQPTNTGPRAPPPQPTVFINPAALARARGSTWSKSDAKRSLRPHAKW